MDTKTPHDADLERAIIGIQIVAPGMTAVTVAAGLTPETFFLVRHRIAQRAIDRANERGLDPDLVNLKQLIPGDDLAEIGGVAGLARLIDGVPRNTAENVTFLVVRLRELAWRRDRLAQLAVAVTQLRDVDAPVAEVRGHLQQIAAAPVPCAGGDARQPVTHHPAETAVGTA